MEQKLNRNQFKGHARLPKFAIPSYYDLYIKLDLVACTFSGNVNININIIEKTNFIVLNALELNVHEVLFTSSHNQEYRPSDAIMDKDDESLVLVFDEPLAAGEGILRIIFYGKLNEHTKGFYKCNEKADEIEAFFASHVQTGVDKVLKQSIEKIRIKARWMESIKQEQSLPALIKQLAHKGY